MYLLKLAPSRRYIIPHLPVEPLPVPLPEAVGSEMTERTEGSDHTERGFSALRDFSGLSGSAGTEIDAQVYEVYELAEEITIVTET
jgi:hypothetical protein